MDGRIVPGFENYLIYPNGDLYSKLRGRFLKKKIDKYGYVIYHTKTGAKQFPTAHYLVATAFSFKSKWLYANKSHRWK